MGERVGNTPMSGIDQREGERGSLLSGGQLLLRQISSSLASFRPPSLAKLLGLSSPGVALSQQGNKIGSPLSPMVSFLSALTFSCLCSALF